MTIIVKLVQSEWSLRLCYSRGKEWPTKAKARSRGHSIQSLDDALIAPKVALRTSGWAKVMRRRYDGNKEGWGGMEEGRDAWKDKAREMLRTAVERSHVQRQRNLALRNTRLMSEQTKQFE